nr:hypothetical protein [Tanacetum cinerariifolium]
MADLNVKYHERALLENQKMFYKRSDRVGSTRKPLDKSKETCFACGKLGHFQKDCPSHKTSTPSYPSLNNSFNKSKPYTPSFNQTSSQNSGNYQKDYKGKYKGLKAEMNVLTKRIDDITKGKSEKGKKEKEKGKKGLLIDSFNWNDEYVSSDDEGSTKIRAFMAITEDEPSVGKKMENLNEVRVKELRSDNGKEFINHKLEEFYDENGISQNLSSFCIPKQNGGEAVNTACYTQNRSIIVNKHRKTSYDMFRGRSLDINNFHVFRCPIHILNHRDHLGKFDEKADDGLFLGYSLVAKAFRVFNIRRQEIEETIHVTFSEDDEAFSQSNTECDAINFNENISFPDDEFLEPRSKVTKCPDNIEYFPYVPAYENTTPSESPILQVFITSEDPPKFIEADNHPALNEPDQAELADYFEPAEPQNNVIIKPISDVQPSPTIPPSAEVILQTPVPQDRRSREKHIELVNIIDKPLAGITTKSRIRDSDVALTFECLYFNFLSEIEPKKLIETLKEEWIIAMQEELNQFERNKEWIDYEETFAPVVRLKDIRIFLAYTAYMGFMMYQMDVKSAFLNGKILEKVYQANPKESYLVAVRRIFMYLKGTLNLGLKMENLNEVRVKELRSDNGKEFINHKLEEFYDENGEAVNTACYTQNRSIIVNKHGKTSYDVFRGRSLDINNFHVFRCPVHIHNHRDHLGKFDEKADDGLFLGYSLVAKAFRVFNIRRQEMEETIHVTFSEDDEAISQSNTECDAINFNENISFPDDEFFEPRSKVTKCPDNIEYFPYVPAYENTTPSESPILQLFVTSEDPPKFIEADNHPALNEPNQTELSDYFKPAEPQNNVIIKPISGVQPSPTIPPSAEVILQTHVPQDRRSREKHIELVNIIDEPLTGITTRSRIRDSDAALTFECLYFNFLSKMEPKKLIETLKEEWIIAMQEELNQFERNKEWIDYEETFAPIVRLKAIRIFLAYAAYMGFMMYQMDVKSAFLNGKILEKVYVQQPLGFESSEFPNHVCKLDKALYGLKQAPRAWYQANPQGIPPCCCFDRKAYSDSDYAGCNWIERVPRRVVRYLKEILWIKSQLADYDVLYDKVPIFCDNTSAIVISNNPVLHSRTKHIDI